MNLDEHWADKLRRTPCPQCGKRGVDTDNAGCGIAAVHIECGFRSSAWLDQFPAAYQQLERAEKK